MQRAHLATNAGLARRRREQRGQRGIPRSSPRRRRRGRDRPWRGLERRRGPPGRPTTSASWKSPYREITPCTRRWLCKTARRGLRYRVSAGRGTLRPTEPNTSEKWWSLHDYMIDCTAEAVPEGGAGAQRTAAQELESWRAPPAKVARAAAEPSWCAFIDRGWSYVSPNIWGNTRSESSSRQASRRPPCARSVWRQ